MEVDGMSVTGGQAGGANPGRVTEIVGLTDDYGDDADIYVTRVRYLGDEADTVELEGVGRLRCLKVSEATRVRDALSRILERAQ
jgi:hypothetical protein